MPSKEEKASKSEIASRSSTGDKNGGSDQQQLEELYRLMQTEGLDSLELKDSETFIRLVRRHAAISTVYSAPLPADQVVAPAVVESVAPIEAGNTIHTPLSGVFYRALSPTSAPFSKEGDTVEPGQTLCIVEAMKVMNEIKADTRCKIVKILVENSRPVTANQALFQVESA